MLSRKDYIGLCDAIAEGVVNKDFIGSLCAWLGNDNPKFNREKFEKFLGTMVEKKKGAMEDVAF